MVLFCVFQHTSPPGAAGSTEGDDDNDDVDDDCIILDIPKPEVPLLDLTEGDSDEENEEEGNKANEEV